MRDFLKQAPESPGDQLILTSDRGTVEIPDGAMLFGAEFERDGRDLLLHNDGAPDIRIIDYFRTAQPADLQSPEGGILRGAVVERLAGPEAPGQYAQAGNPAGADPIGQVESVDGIASVQRTDGTTEPLNPETKIFLGDVVQTGPAGNLSITFADGTIFTLSPASRMVIDELIYSASGQNNSATFNLVQGGFVFIAGQIAHTGGMDVTTPAATMGIRGTTVLVDVQTQNGISTVEVTLTRDPGGSLGRFELFDNAGSLIATVSGTNNKWVVSTEDGETREVARTSDDERADNVLIAEATAAYETAFQRFNQSGSFVELDNIRRGTGQAPDVQNLDGSDSDGIDLDNQDDAPPPELAPAPTPELPTEEDLEREGRNELHEPERNIRVTGLEDSEDAPIAGLLPTGGGSNIFALVELPGNGTVNLGADGSYIYVPDPNFFGSDEFTYTVTTPGGEVEDGEVLVTILPVNDVPIIDNQKVKVTEDGAITGQATATDFDDDTLSYRLLTGAASGSVVVTRDGVWVYTPDPDYAGADRFSIEVSDPDGATATQVVRVSVTGTNDTPVVTSGNPDAKGSVTETTSPTTSGQLTATDADAGAVLAWTGSAAGIYGSFTIGTDGAWSYSLGTAADALTAGESVTERFTATVSDDQGATATETVAIRITGTNDLPVVTSGNAEAKGSVTETTSPTTSGQLTASDADAGAVLGWTGSADGTYGSFTIGTDGAWSYSLGAAADALTVGESVTERFTATVTDDQGATATETVAIRITGTNDLPVVTSGNADAKGSVTETTSPTTSGQLTASDADTGAVLAWTGSADGTYGSFTIGTDGAWSYSLGAAADALTVGESVTERFIATVSDDQGATATETVVIRITGTNDAPVITSSNADAKGSVTETTSPSASGKLSASDADAGAVLAWTGSADGTYGSFTIGTDGAWSYSLGTAAEALTAGESVTERFTATVTDDEGATATETVVIRITGTKDLPVVTSGNADAKGSVTETTSPTTSGQLTATDADAGAVLAWTGSAAGTYGSFIIGADGAWSYSLGTAAEALTAGESVTERFTATVTDDEGATATETVVIRITGTNDAPVITTTQTDVETIQGASVSGQLTAVDLDAGTVLAFALGSDEPEHGTVQIAANGSWTYTPDASFAGIDSFGYSVTDDQGATATSSITVAVNSAPHPTTSGQIVTLNIEPTPGGLPAGSVIASASPISGPEVNLVVALDRSGSIGSAQWQTEINAVADALDVLKAQFAGSATHVEVQVITYADTARVEGTFDLDDPALGSTLRTLPYSGGTTNWTQTIYLTEAFFDRQPAGETNFLYFISDGSPSSGSWQPVFDRMTNEDAKGYSVNVEAFGIGGSIDLATLSILDATPQLLSGPADLVDGFTETPLFSARLVDLSVTLITDGTDMGEIADETAETLVISGFDATLSLADIDGLASLLGSQNRISVTGGFDLDGDPSTVELTLFASERFGVAEAAQTTVGTDGSDLLFGSDEADTLTGNGGNDVILAFDGDDTLTLGAGADTVMAGAGDDFITITSFDGLTGGRVESIDGGDGRDTLKITAPVDVEPDYLSLVDLSGIEVLDIANGHADDLDLTIGDLLDLSGSDDDLLAGLLGAAPGQSLTVLGEAGDSLTLTEAPNGQFVDTGTQVEGMDGTTLNVFQYTSGSDVLHTLAVDADVTVNVQTAAA